MSKEKKDHEQHYRFSYNGINIDPFRICQIYNVNDFALQTIVKKALCAGNRGYKDFEQDLLDIICAAQRRIEMLREDLGNLTPDPNQEVEKPWIKNTSNVPSCKLIKVLFADGTTTEGRSEAFDWTINGKGWNIVKYQILDTENQAIAGHPETKQELVWIKNTGDIPNCSKVMAKLVDGTISPINSVRCLSWGIDDDYSDYEIDEYQILE